MDSVEKPDQSFFRQHFTGLIKCEHPVCFSPPSVNNSMPAESNPLFPGMAGGKMVPSGPVFSEKSGEKKAVLKNFSTKAKELSTCGKKAVEIREVLYFEAKTDLLRTK